MRDADLQRALDEAIGAVARLAAAAREAASEHTFALDALRAEVAGWKARSLEQAAALDEAITETQRAESKVIRLADVPALLAADAAKPKRTRHVVIEDHAEDEAATEARDFPGRAVDLEDQIDLAMRDEVEP